MSPEEDLDGDDDSKFRPSVTEPDNRKDSENKDEAPATQGTTTTTRSL